MRFSRVECDNDALMLEINFYILNTFDFHERPTEFSDCLMTIFAFGSDLNCFQDRVIGALREKGIGWIRIVWSGGVHRV